MYVKSVYFFLQLILFPQPTVIKKIQTSLAETENGTEKINCISTIEHFSNQMLKIV